jgi:hypothetical protein
MPRCLLRMKEGARVHHSYGSYAPSTYGTRTFNLAERSVRINFRSCPGPSEGPSELTLRSQACSMVANGFPQW